MLVQRLFGLLIFCVTSAHAQTPLPEKLDFTTAMQLVDEGQYMESLLAKSELERLQSDLQSVDGINDVNVELNAVAQFVEPSVTTAGQGNDDHRLSILVKKQLLDFGYSDNKQQAAEARIRAAGFNMQDMRLQKRIEVADRFFKIQLADLLYTLDNEAIAVAFIRYDKIKDKNELKMASDVDMLEAEFEYQKVRAQRIQSETMQRVARAAFAESINRPKDLPSEVIMPDISFIKNKRPEYEELLELAMANNYRLRAQQLLTEAAVHELQASRDKNGSTLSTELEVAEYSYETASKNNIRAALKYSLPLYDNGSDKAEVGRALAEWNRQKVKLAQVEAEVRQQLLEVWQQILVLKTRQDIDKVAEEFRELYQDRSRAYYEMEYRTDLGDSFVRVTEARVEKFKNNTALALAWMKLAALTGVTLEEYLKQ